MTPSSNAGRNWPVYLVSAAVSLTFVVFEAQAGQRYHAHGKAYRSAGNLLPNHMSGNVFNPYSGAVPRPVVRGQTVHAWTKTHGPKYKRIASHPSRQRPGYERRGYGRPDYWDYHGNPYWRAPAAATHYGYSRFAETPVQHVWGEAPLAPAPSFVEVRRGPRVIYGTEIQPPPARVRIVYGEGPFGPGPVAYEARR